MTIKNPDPFDISEMVGNKVPTIQTPKLQTFSQSPVQIVPLTGIILAIPVDNKRFRSVDIAQCTNKEFIDWLGFVYPLETNFSEQEIRLPGQKLEILKRMEFFHSRQIFAAKSRNLSNN